MTQQVRTGKMPTANRQFLCELHQVIGKKIIRILDQLLSCEPMRDTQHRRTSRQQEYPASESLEQSIESFQDDADVERAVIQQLPASFQGMALGTAKGAGTRGFAPRPTSR